MQTDTIAAIATPLGEGALGIIRISGPRVLAILKKVFHPSSRTDVNVSHIVSHSVHHGYIINPNDSGSPSSCIQGLGSYMDEVLVTVMRAPHSYTRENTVEISGHGNPLILHRILDSVIKAGARPAEPGEFTKRAFLNGRIDLSQAEAVIDLINARTEEASRTAFHHLKGNLSRRTGEIQDSLKETITLLEAEIDFPEEEIVGLNTFQLHERLKKLVNDINTLISTHIQGKILKEGIYTAIIGKANVGKSSLFNVLTEAPARALVTPVPGTTRDIIEECINLKGRFFRVMDTAGLKSPRGRIERESLKITKDRIKVAMCNIFLLDGSKALAQKDLEIGREALKKPTIIAVNKIDLPQKLSLKKVNQYFPQNAILTISCKEKIGIEELKGSLVKLSEKFYKNTHQSDSEIIITNIRHKNLLEKAKSSIHDALKTLNKGGSSEFIVTDLRYGLESLQEITGEHITEDILNNIFSRFCIGK